jgi:hypothetical protein
MVVSMIDGVGRAAIAEVEVDLRTELDKERS